MPYRLVSGLVLSQEEGLMSGRIRSTPGQRAAIVKAYASGLPVEQIEKRYHVSPFSVREWAKRAGVPLRKTMVLKKYADITPQIMKLHHSGASFKAIAREVGVSPYIVGNIVTRNKDPKLIGKAIHKKTPESNSSLRNYIAEQLKDSGFGDRATQLVRELVEAELKSAVESAVAKALEALS